MPDVSPDALHVDLRQQPSAVIEDTLIRDVRSASHQRVGQIKGGDRADAVAR
jgi:hypothetical protein